MAKRRRQGKRFRLLIYERMWQRWAGILVLIILASLVMWWFSPSLSLETLWEQALTLVPAIGAGLILLFAFFSRRMAWVQCRSNHLRIQTPFYPLAVSYGRIKGTYPQQFHEVFDPAKVKGGRRRWLEPYWGQTVLLVELSRYPVRESWLRLWFSPYLLLPDSPGFVFLVDDWMGLSRQLDDYRAAWATRRRS